MSAHGPVISSWSAVSAYGVGRDPLIAGMRAGMPARTAIDPQVYPSLPVNEARLVPAAGPQDLLGRKGTRSMDRATALAVSAVGQLLAGDGNAVAGKLDENAGIVLGTSTGSIHSIMSFIRDALTQEKPYFVDAARFPNTVMNCAASRSAIWHKLRGPNVTIAGGRAAAILALNHARRLQQSGRANSVVCGAVEEFSAERAWLAWHTRTDDRESMLLGEGAAVMLLETAEASVRPALAEVLSIEVGLAACVDEVGSVLADCLNRVVEEIDGGWDGLWAVAPSTPPGRLGQQERDTLERVLGDRDRLELSCMDWLGDTYSAAGAFQIVALLTEAQRRPEAAGRLALVTAIDRDGLVAVSLLRISPDALS